MPYGPLLNFSFPTCTPEHGSLRASGYNSNPKEHLHRLYPTLVFNHYSSFPATCHLCGIPVSISTARLGCQF